MSRVVLALLTVAFSIAAEALVLSGRFETPGEAHYVEVVGHLAYVADGSGGLRIVDVSKPAEMREVGALDTLTDVRSIDVSHRPLVYVAAGAEGLRVLDVSDSSDIVELGAFETPGSVTGVVVDEGLAYILDEPFGLRIVDVSDPRHPIERGTERSCRRAPHPGQPRIGLEVHDGIVYLPCSTFFVIDASDPSAPTQLSRSDVGATALDVVVVNDFAYLAGGEAGLYVLDVSNPAQPFVVGSVDTFFAGNVRISGREAYLADGRDGLRVIDVADPSAPRALGALTTDGTTRGVGLVDGFAIVSVAGEGLNAISTRQRETPREVGALNLFGADREVAVVGDVAYVAEDVEGLRLIDVSDPVEPVQLGQLRTPGRAFGVEVVDGIAYVADFESLRIIDVSDPSLPREIGFLDTTGFALRLAVQDGIAYVEDRSDGLTIVDVSNPRGPQRLATLDRLRHVEDVDVIGHIAYVVHSGGDELVLVDVSDPRAPVELGSISIPSPLQVAVAGELAYVSSGSGFEVIDVSDPMAPVRLSGVGGLFGAVSIERKGSLVFLGLRVTLWERGIVLAFDASDSLAPVLLGGLAVPDVPFDLELADGLVYVAAHGAGLRALEFGPEYPPPRRIEIDIRPRSPVNLIHPMSRGLIEVAILGSDDFPVQEVEASTLAFGPGHAMPIGPRRGVPTDVNGDGVSDLLSFYRIAETGIGFGDVEACLSGRTFGGVELEGCDAIRTVPPCGSGFELAVVVLPLWWLRAGKRRKVLRKAGRSGRPSRIL